MVGIAMASGSPLLGTRLPTRISTPPVWQASPHRPEMRGEILVQLNETGRSDRSWWEPRKESHHVGARGSLCHLADDPDWTEILTARDAEPSYGTPSRAPRYAQAWPLPTGVRP